MTTDYIVARHKIDNSVIEIEIREVKNGFNLFILPFRHEAIYPVPKRREELIKIIKYLYTIEKVVCY